MEISILSSSTLIATCMVKTSEAASKWRAGWLSNWIINLWIIRRIWRLFCPSVICKNRLISKRPSYANYPTSIYFFLSGYWDSATELQAEDTMMSKTQLSSEGLSRHYILSLQREKTHEDYSVTFGEEVWGIFPGEVLPVYNTEWRVVVNLAKVEASGVRGII